MSYNTRRSGGFGGNQQSSVANIGQRRPVVTNNFVPGGQLAAQQKPINQMSQQQQQRPPQQQQQQQQQQPQQQPSINFRNQQNQQQQRAPPPPQQTQQQQPAGQQGYSTQSPPVKTESPIPSETAPAPTVPAVANPPPVEALDNGQDESMDDSTTEDTPKKKPFWVNKLNKISKKERQRRRNLRLSRMLQPKNAVMILNELIRNAAYNVEEVPVKVDPNQYKATVSFDNQTHVGLGRSKIAAKNAAAESALKYLIKNKQLDLKKDENGDEQMEVTEDGSTILPWQHVASFALFKLFSSWGEDPSLTTRVGQVQEVMGCPKATAAMAKQHENKPAKKMPENPEKLNPLMLINQMLPQAQFEEVGKSGNPPNVTFSFKCIVEDETFMGTGPNKKTAKKYAAFGACHKVLGINYPPEVYVPIY